MTTINTSFKTDLYSDPTAGQTPEGAPGAGLAELRARLEEAYAELEAMDPANLNDVQYDERERLMVTMKAEMAAIDGVGINGGSPAGTDPGAWVPSQLEAGWNNVPAGYPSTDIFPGDTKYMNEDYDAYGEYAGSIEIPNSQDYAYPHTIAYQLSEGDTLWGETHGRDIVLIVQHADQSKEYYVIKNGAIRWEPIVISAYGLTNGVTIDLSRVYRVNDGTFPANAYETQKMYVCGGEGHDIIYGSQSRDKIVGMGGNDTIDAGAGNDMVWGDDYYPIAGAGDPLDGGEDTIRGGAGNDTIYGGGGMDTGYVSDKGEQIYELLGERAPLNDVLAEPPDGDFISSYGADGNSGTWEVDDEADEDGTIVLHNVTSGDHVEGGIINIDMEQLEDEGYTMAYGEEDGNGNLVITFVGTDPDTGQPQTFKLVIEDFFTIFGGSENPKGVVRLNINGTSGDDIIDMSRVEHLEGQIINIVGGEGDDIILGARSALLSDGLNPDNFFESMHNSPGVLSGMVDEGIYYTTEPDPYEGLPNKHDYNGFHATVENDQIVISDADGDLSNNNETLSVIVPPGYEKAYLMQDADSGDFYLVCVKPGVAGAEPQTIVFKINANCGLGWEDITARYRVAGTSDDDDDDKYSYVSITAMADLMDDEPDDGEFGIEYNFMLDGGEGSDMVIGQKGSHNETDDPGEFTELGEQPTQPISNPIPGDTNGDGVVDQNDQPGGGGGGGGGGS